MARAKKKTTPKRTKAASRSKKKTAAKKSPSKKKAPRPARTAARTAAKTRPQTDVERRWTEYWECRTALEGAVAEVREIEGQLSEARERERNHRATFEQTKEALKTLLEVEELGGGGTSARSSRGKGLLSLAEDHPPRGTRRRDSSSRTPPLSAEHEGVEADGDDGDEGDDESSSGGRS